MFGTCRADVFAGNYLHAVIFDYMGRKGEAILLPLTQGRVLESVLSMTQLE